jgi:hypothetical protein
LRTYTSAVNSDPRLHGRRPQNRLQAFLLLIPFDLFALFRLRSDSRDLKPATPKGRRHPLVPAGDRSWDDEMTRD